MVNHNQSSSVSRQNYSHEYRIECLRSCFHEWRASETGRRLPDHVMGLALCEAVDALGLAGELSAHDVPLYQHPDPVERGQMMMRSMWRWLGCSADCKEQPRNVFFYERAILKALPSDIAIRYAGLLLPCHLQVSTATVASAAADIVALTQGVHKECSEAVAALLPLSSGSSIDQLRETDREIGEAIAALATAQEQVKGLMLSRSSASEIKAVRHG